MARVHLLIDVCRPPYDRRTDDIHNDAQDEYIVNGSRSTGSIDRWRSQIEDKYDLSVRAVNDVRQRRVEC